MKCYSGQRARCTGWVERVTDVDSSSDVGQTSLRPFRPTHNTHKRQMSMPPEGYEPTVLEGERPQTYVLDHAEAGTGFDRVWRSIKKAK